VAYRLQILRGGGSAMKDMRQNNVKDTKEVSQSVLPFAKSDTPEPEAFGDEGGGGFLTNSQSTEPDTDRAREFIPKFLWK
jgi:hypothetical protein